jgi:hypothetical protein
MTRETLRRALAAAMASFSCSSAGGGDAGDADSARDMDAAGATDAGSGDSAIATFSCTQASVFLCTEVVASASERVAEEQACAAEPGTFGAGCARSGAVGCCAQGGDTQCYYSAAEAMIAKSICAGPGMTWSMADEQ